MKVTHYIGSFGFGGIGRLVHDLIKLQNNRLDLDISLCVGSPSGEFKAQFENLISKHVNFSLNSGYDISLLKILNIYKHFKSMI